MLIQTIESVNQQDFDLSSVEIIVVSQTPSIVDMQLAQLNVALNIHVRPAAETISALRNFGVEQSKGQYLAFLDADIYLSTNWIESMLAELRKDNNRIITSAIQICDESAPPLEKIRTHLSNAEVDVDVNFLPGRNLFMTKGEFHNIGGFPEHLVTCEDYFFTDKAANLGSLFYTSAANYIHLGEDKQLVAMFKKEIWRGQSNLQSLQGRRIPLREWPSIIVPPAIFFCLLFACLLFIGGLNSLAGLFIIFAALPITAYTFRLWRIAKSDVSFSSILLFYLYYFPARAYGTFIGVFKTITVKQG